MTASYYIIQIFTFIEAAGILMLMWILLTSSGPLYIFKNRNHLLKLFAAAVLISANVVIVVSMLTEGQEFPSSAGSLLGLLIDFITVIFAAACLITILTSGRNRGMKKEEARIVTIPMRQLKIHTSIRPMPYLQMREDERVQTGIWNHDGIQEFLIFTGGTLTGLKENSDIVMEIVPHDEKTGVYYVTRVHVKGKKSVVSHILDIVSFAAGTTFVLSVLFMNHDSIVLHVPLPYPDGYPSVSLMAASIAAMLFKWVGSISGNANSKSGNMAVKIFKAIIYILLLMSLLSLADAFGKCLKLYL